MTFYQQATQSNNSNPFYSGERTLKIDSTVAILLAVAFIIFAIICIAMHNYTRRKIREYKNKQLEEYKIKNPSRKNATYENARLYLPAWQRAKYNAHIFLAVIFIVGAIAFLSGSTLTTL